MFSIPKFRKLDASLHLLWEVYDGWGNTEVSWTRQSLTFCFWCLITRLYSFAEDFIMFCNPFLFYFLFLCHFCLSDLLWSFDLAGFLSSFFYITFLLNKSCDLATLFDWRWRDYLNPWRMRDNDRGIIICWFPGVWEITIMVSFSFDAHWW